jgi:hypothetical protein
MVGIYNGGRKKRSLFFWCVMILGFLGLTLAGLVKVATITAAAFTVYNIVEQRKLQKKTASTAKKLGAQQLEAQREYAGQYLILTKEQMEMQSQQRRIETLANVITEQRSAQPAVFTLPKGPEPSVVDQINSVIDRIVRG